MKRAKPAEGRVPPRPRPSPATRKLPNRFLRYLLNVWVVVHFTGIIAAAASIGPAPGYVLAVWDKLHPYLQFFFLNHGYNFFAPEPAASTLLEFEAIRADGSIVKGNVPDPTLRPRLLYQRHLLLTEHIGIAPQAYTEKWYQSYAQHICKKYGAAKVHLIHVVHGAMPMEMFRDGARLDAPFTFNRLDLGEFTCDKP